MLPVYRFLADRIGRRLGRRVELVVGRSFDQFEWGEADLGVICGLPYVWLAARRPPPVEPLAAPVLAGPRYGGRPVYYSDVIVRHDSPITRLGELRGRSWAYNEPASHSGHTVTLYSLISMGAGPGFLGPVLQAGFHQRAIRLVASGAVEAAAVDSQVLGIEFRDHPRLADRLRLIDAFGPSTIQPVVAARHLPSRLREQAREALVELAGDRAPGRCSTTASSTGSPPSGTPTTTTSGPCWPPPRGPAGPASPRRLSTPDVSRYSRTVDQRVLSAASEWGRPPQGPTGQPRGDLGQLVAAVAPAGHPLAAVGGDRGIGPLDGLLDLLLEHQIPSQGS
jgi:phosphonate transport system substrate-binding protein